VRRPRRAAIAGLVALVVAACAGSSRSAELLPLPATADTGAVTIAQPTLIGFHPRPTRGRVADSAFVRTLAEFQSGLAHLRPMFEQAGVAVYEQYTDTLVLREPARGLQIYVPPAATPVGYYLAAPGREPDILHGLRPEADIQQAAWRYFHSDGTRQAAR
jgi:hypothetical protein